MRPILCSSVHNVKLRHVKCNGVTVSVTELKSFGQNFQTLDNNNNTWKTAWGNGNSDSTLFRGTDGAAHTINVLAVQMFLEHGAAAMAHICPMADLQHAVTMRSKPPMTLEHASFQGNNGTGPTAAISFNSLSQNKANNSNQPNSAVEVAIS